MAPATTIGLFSLLDHLGDPVTGREVTVAERLRQVIEQGILAERAGFERFGVGEHHFSGYLLSNPTPLLAALASRTSRIRLFTAVTLLACRDPVRVAEDIGILDCLCDGRLEVSVARGVSWEAAQVFGINRDNVYQLMAQKLATLLGILATGQLVLGEPSAGKTVAVVPRPVQRPTPPIWLGGGLHAESCALAVENGLPLFLPSLFRHPEDYLPLVEQYRAGMRAAGRAHRIRLGLPSYCWVARTSQDARRVFRPRLETYIRFAQGLRDGAGRPLDFDSLLEGPAICGSPAEVIDRIGKVNEMMDLDSHVLMMDLGGVPLDELADALDLMGREVLPALRPPATKQSATDAG
jgi:alkanesulfonate monooxygenase SsuD/methylene tetrahydromethanopterin reductase-like flavin-dependent oxidoreductase (luciferase family)